MWTWKADRPVGTIVIIHGASEYHGRYKWLVEMWRSSGYNVVMGDLPGQGTSTRARGHIRSFQEYIDEVDIWIDKARTLEAPVFLLGHSMGGLIAIEWFKQQRNPRITALILSSPCLGLQIKVNKVLDFASKGLNVLAPSLRVDSGLSPDMATRNADMIEADQNDSLYVTKVSVRWYRELLKTIDAAMVPTDSFLKVPLLLMQGGDDKIVDKMKVRKWFSGVASHNKSYREWEGLYHEIFNEPERETVFKAAKAFTDQYI
ncbi:alpha/beta hydrolase [Bacillus sp. ChL18]|uniref:alpha/beta hydrolase n=1 Tax=Bacillus TaxID=1386 RepID=UPI00224892D1|nr:alpha/beta hydrolase [Bacillus sp. ChL18]MCX2808436.1 alpha/beta hydrolase [Bacillus sp. ChL18]